MGGDGVLIASKNTRTVTQVDRFRIGDRVQVTEKDAGCDRDFRPHVPEGTFLGATGTVLRTYDSTGVHAKIVFDDPGLQQMSLMREGRPEGCWFMSRECTLLAE